MILTCPNCGTQYVVKDGAIPPQGRQVRCAACKHGWHQDPEPGDAPSEGAQPPAHPGAEADLPAMAQQPDPLDQAEQAQPPEQPDVVPEQEESFAEASLIEPRSGPEAEQRAYEGAVIESESGLGVASTQDFDAPPDHEAQDDEFSPFPAPDEVEPRRRRPLVTLLAIVVLVAALAAAFWFLAPPEWKAQVGLGGGSASPLALVTTHMDRQRLESGNELLTITGRVINPTSKDQEVPPLRAQLRSRSGQLVYSWTIAPPARTLPPGASASFNSAEMNVPPGGEELTITVGPPRA